MCFVQYVSGLHGTPLLQDSAISSCQIDDCSISLLFCLELVLDVLHEQGDLTYGESRVENPLVPALAGVNNRFDAGIDKSLEDLVGATEQSDGIIAIWVLYLFRRLWDRSY